ncbi:related to beta-glucosidase [Cephalotrichum gorgonifer]|uniref:Probable beta-glucosidase btgE n=1 Tax=Cephalotrichum gorgonifer TaxID=2041049 RepID=A0AAE8MQN7_9PEZI|nr:related to beta-glucosidase [Cephalotrichum gorgonifer]
MKGTVAKALVAMAGAASAAHVNHHRRAHELFARGTGVYGEESCLPKCTTYVTTIYGEPTLINKPTPTETPAPVVPTPEVSEYPEPGTYSWDATTITISETTTVCAATTVECTPGTNTYGGVTTVVDTPTTVTCDVAVETTQPGGVVTSTLSLTTFVCPTPGTYTIGASETVVEEETVVVYPVPATYEPGTYTKPAGVVTVTETGYVTVCPWEGGPTPAPAPTPAPTPAPEPQPEPAPAPAPEPAPKPEEPKPTPEVPSGGDYGLGGGNQDHWAITYTPYTEDASGSCKSRDQVFADVKKIKSLGFNTLRIYSTDCNTLQNVGDAVEEAGLKLIIGVFVKEAGCGYSGTQKKQVEELVAWGKWHLVSLCVIGNESIFSGLCNANQLKSLIDTAKTVFIGAGYKGPFTTAETVDVWQKSGSVLCDSIDITGANTHPYFNAGTSPSDAGKFVQGQLDIVSKICGQRAISLECGWPTQGNVNGAAAPGIAEQAEAVKSIRSTCGADVVFFTYGKALWKGDSACGCEPYFNIEGAF